MLYNRKLIAIIVTGVLIIVLPIFIFLVQRSQENRSRATAATTLALAVLPNNQPITVDDPISVTLTANPGTTNLLSVISFTITYDKTKVAPTASPFTINPALTSWKVVAPVQVNPTNGTITGTYSIGADPTQAIQRTTQFGTFGFTAISGTEGQQTAIALANNSAVYSIGSTDTANENVLTSTTPAQFSIASSAVPTLTPTPSGQACLSVITYAVNDTTNECKQYGSSCIPTGWHTVDECPAIQTHSINWSTNDVSVQADDFYISISGEKYVTTQTVQVAAVPSTIDPKRVALEAKWTESGREMRVKMEFAYPTENNFWRLAEIWSYKPQNGNSYMSYNPYDAGNNTIQHALGETYQTSDIYFTQNQYPYATGTTNTTLSSANSRIYFKNLKIQAFKAASPTVKIQGNVVDEGGSPSTTQGVTVRLFKYDNGSLATATQIASSNTATWSFDNLPRAVYRVAINAPTGFSVKSNVCNDCTFHPNYSGTGTEILDFQSNLQSNMSDISFQIIDNTPPVIIDDTAYLAINVGLHGIGYAGDNASPGRQVSFSPTNPAPTGPDDPKPPLNLSRDASIQFYNEQNQLLYTIPKALQFSPDTYAFGSIFPLSSEAVSVLGGKTVSVRISVPKYLTIIYPLVAIKSVGTTNLPYKPLITGNVYSDATNQNQLDILDYNAIMDCREDVDTVNKSGTCSVDADLNDDGRVDVFDYQLFIRELSVQAGL